MTKYTAKLVFVGALLLLIFGCGGTGPEQQEIQKLAEDFVVAIDNGNFELASECCLDIQGYYILHPDVASEGRTSAQEMVGDLEDQYMNMVSYFQGRNVRMKRFQLGSFWDEYEGYAGFRNSVVTLNAEGEDYKLILTGIIRVADKWYIIDLSGNNFN